MRQTLTESLLLALAGGVLGIALAAGGAYDFWCVRLPLDLPRLSRRSPGWTRAGFCLADLARHRHAFGILPALRSAGAQPQEALKSGSYTTTESRRGVRLRASLVGAEAALSAVLLITAGLLMGSFVRLMHVDKGFRYRAGAGRGSAMPPTKYTEKPADGRLFRSPAGKDAHLYRACSRPAWSPRSRLQGETWIDLAAAEGDQRPLFERPMVNVRFVSPDYFRTLRIPFREGRPFDDSQRNRKVVIVSQGTARRLWPGQSPLGAACCTTRRPEEVVGVTADIRSTSLDKDPVLIIYIPYWQRPRLSAALLVRTAMDPRGIAAGVREVIHQVDADVPVPEMQTLRASDVGLRSAAPLPDDAGDVVRRPPRWHWPASASMAWFRIRWRAAARRWASAWHWARARPPCSGWCCGKAFVPWRWGWRQVSQARSRPAAS